MKIHFKRGKALLAFFAAVTMLFMLFPLNLNMVASAGSTVIGVVNGGFEDGTNGWELSANKTNATAINRDAHSGSMSLLLDFPMAWGAAATQFVNVEKNTDYIVSFWAKRVSGTGAWNLYVMKDDASTNMNVTGGTWFNQTTTDWKLISYQFNSGDEEKVFLKFGPESNDAGTFLVDDVAVTEKGTGLFNGDFEIDSLGWTLGGATKITDDAHAGQKALELSYPTAWGAAATQVVSVEKNTNYTISFWTKRVSGTGAWHFSVMDNSASHANVPLTEGGTWFNQTTTDWKQVTYEFNSGNLTEVFLKFNPEIKDAGVFHVDDVLLTKKLGVANGSFEQGTNGWTLSSAETNKTAISDDAHGGNKALLLDYPSAWGAAATQYVNVKKDTKYTVMFWTKRVSGTGAWDLYVMKGDLSGNMPVVGDMYFNQTTNEWKQISFYFNSGDEEKVFLKFAPESNSSGTFLVDDVSIVVKEDVYGVKNGGFESGSEEWKLSGNTAISEDAYSGEKALLLSFSQQWGVAAIQTIQVKKDTEYVLSFWTKRVSGNGAWHLCVVDPKDNYKELTYTGGEKWFNHTDGLWHKSRVEFNSGDREELCLKITPEDTNSVFLIDDIGVYVKGTEPPDLPKPKALTLTSFGVDTNRPVSADANLLKNASFEATEGAQWNVTTFLNDTLKVVDDETAPDGKKSLYFDTSAVTSAAWHVFWVDVEPGKDYTFSGWVKGAFLADDNRAQGTFGVIDPDTGKFLIYSPNANRTSKETLQLQPTAWDNEWHLRSVTFNSGEKKKVGIAVYGHSSKMWIDDIALYEVSDGVKYVSKLATSSITPKFDVQHSSCADEDNLINDATLSSKDGKAFWTSGAGWKNAFMSIRESKYEYGDSLRYVGSEDSKGISYIKWIDVEPNTNYTFSAKLKVLQDGDGKLVLMDNKMTGAANFIEVDFDSENYGNDWFSFAINFNSDVFTRIGISVVDLGGEVLLDNIRLFETDKGIDATDTYVEPPEEGEDPDTPNTGFNMAGALVAGALIPASAAVMAKLDRKKRKRQNG